MRAETIGPLALAAVLISVPCRAQEQQRTAVSIEAKLEARRFRLQFLPQLQSVEDRAARRFKRLLSREIGFLNFVVHDTSASYRLVFTLDVRERGADSPFPEFGFWARLEQPDSTRVELYWLPLRSAEHARDGVGTMEGFLGELEVKLTGADVGGLRDSLLTKIPIAQQALILDSPLGWVIAYPRLELCMKTKSLLEVVSNFNQNGMSLEKLAQARVVSDFPTSDSLPARKPFLGGAFSEPAQPADAAQLAQLLLAGPLTVKEVYVTSYVHDPNACRDRGGDEP